MYHDIFEGNKGNHPYSVSKNNFIKQMEYLNFTGYKVVLIDEFLKFAKKGVSDIGNLAIITFDDSQISNYSIAFPILKQFGFYGEFFLATQFIGKGKDAIEKSHIREMAEEGMSIQSHTHSHRFLNNLNQNQIYNELTTSKNKLQEITGKVVNHLSCPGGFFRVRE